MPSRPPPASGPTGDVLKGLLGYNSLPTKSTGTDKNNVVYAFSLYSPNGLMDLSARPATCLPLSFGGAQEACLLTVHSYSKPGRGSSDA